MTLLAVRHLHRILATRILATPIFDERQRAFVPADGTAENTAVLDALVGTARSELRELHLATLDVAKAFDSLSHHALVAVVEQVGFPPAFVRYIANLYGGATTRFVVGGRTSPEMPVRRGVRQGDPLSPLLFNMAVDVVLRAVPDEVGFAIEGHNISSLAFADDLVLVSSSRVGMQTTLTRVEEAAESMGLVLNHQKSSTFSLVPDGKTKRIKILTQRTFALRGPRFLPSVGVLDVWRYLGVEYGFTGVRPFEQVLDGVLRNITRAPLKPQQRLHILRSFLIPRFYHALVLGRVSAGRLRALDRQVRKSVRAWLRLPDDVTLGYFHASVSDGGLGVPALVTLIPSLIVARIGRLETSGFGAARAAFWSPRIQRKLRWAEGQVARFRLPRAPAAEDRQRHWAAVLHNSVDGRELRECSRSSLSTRWVCVTSAGIPGRDYVQYCHVRANCLPSRMRTSRGARRADRQVLCRAGCGVPETAAHTIQGCWRTHGGRIRRHDAICNTVADALRKRGWEVSQEPRFRTSAGLRKPDIIARRGMQGVIIDTQVVSGGPPLADSHRRKRAYYAGDEEVVAGAAAFLQLPRGNIETTTCTVSWRGVWCEASHRHLSACGLSDAQLAGITTRVLQGSHTNWSRFNRMTEMARGPGGPVPRVGVG